MFVLNFPAGDRFLLISMCFDDRYFNTMLGYTLLQELGLFPLNFRFVQLVRMRARE